MVGHLSINGQSIYHLMGGALMARCPARVGITVVRKSALSDVISLANFSAGCIVGDIVGSSWSWWWAKVECECFAVSGQLLGRFPNGAVGVDC